VTWVVPLALGGFAVLIWAVFTMVSARRRHYASIAPAQVVGPRILVHDINDDRCTGCDACVAVCPTNVLDLVENKSRVLRFQDCIQCEACMFACPTEALVMFPEGSQPPPLKVPEIDETFQTAVPGQYLIGEVAGKPLVKNAANLGRAVVEHMLASGMRSGALGRGENVYDVAIVGSGPGGLSTALTCIQRGLSYVMLEKEQEIASTIARYPKGKLVMAEPYDSENLSLLPVFDSSKEQLIPIWKELIERIGVKVRKGESVESVQAHGNAFDVRTTVASYRAQRVVLSIGTRGKPRTLQVKGENLPKVYSLLDDPDEWRGKNVLVVGGGDSAVEAALALADAGAKVMISYRGKGFARAQPKNKQAIEQYAAEGKLKAKLGSTVLAFDPESVTLALADGQQKRYPNLGAFVLIGADPPIAWLEKLGIRFVERPHQYQLGKSDDIVRRFVPRAIACPEDAARAAAQVLGGSVGIAPAPARPLPPPRPIGEPLSGPRKWLRSATSIFSSKEHTPAPRPRTAPGVSKKQKKFDRPVPLSEFATGNRGDRTHTGHGRRDQLSAGERTRILRMLRDEGGRLADEDEDPVYIGTAPGPARAPIFDFDIEDDSIAPPPPNEQARRPAQRPDMPAKPAVVVGLAQANNARRQKRQSGAPPVVAGTAVPPRAKPPTAPPPQQPPPRDRRAPLPAPFDPFDESEPTRALGAAEAPKPPPSNARPLQRPVPRGQFDQQETKVAGFDPRALAGAEQFPDETRPEPDPSKFMPTSTEPAPYRPLSEEEATSVANLENIARVERANRDARAQKNEERTRAVDIRNDPSISDIDWDID
jgi:thioredoxin reductase/ferredoxin